MAEENFGLRKLWTVFFVMMILAVLLEVNAEKKKNSDDDKQKKKKKKDLRDYNDADLERLFDEWEVSWFNSLLIEKAGCCGWTLYLVLRDLLPVMLFLVSENNY